jgi:hypothetical protein
MTVGELAKGIAQLARRDWFSANRKVKFKTRDATTGAVRTYTAEFVPPSRYIQLRTYTNAPTQHKFSKVAHQNRSALPSLIYFFYFSFFSLFLTDPWK